MKKTPFGVVVVAFLATTVPQASGESELVLDQVLEPGVSKQFEHQNGIVLKDGFWAKAGSDVTAKTAGAASTQLLQMVDVEVVTTGAQAPPRPQPDWTPGVLYSGSREAEFSAKTVVQVGKNVELPNPKNFYAVTHIGIEEERNNPCRIILVGRMVDERFRTQERPLAEFRLDTCKVKTILGFKPPLASGTPVDFQITGFNGPERFIRGLNVCMGGKGPTEPFGTGLTGYKEIKGLRVRPAEVTQGESTHLLTNPLPLDQYSEWTRAHCPEKGKEDTGEGWSKWNMCPDDQLLTGVDVYSRDKEFIALGVRCKSVQFQMSQAPVKDGIGY